MYKRTICTLFPRHSFFLFGPRQVGKSTVLTQQNYLHTVDLLSIKNQLQYNQNPDILKEEIDSLSSKNGKIFIDEIQKVPALLDVVQEMMTKYPKLFFVMSGSSARKLRHGAANLLGGRALYRSLYPLTEEELGDDFKLSKVLNYGSLPKVYSVLMENNVALCCDLLRTYVITYLNEEIKAEALVRKLASFQNFLEIAASQFGQQINLSEVGRDCGASYNTVKEYYSILEDTLIGFFQYPYLKSFRKRMSHSPKFYLFDNGVTRAINGNVATKPDPVETGRLYEQWVLQELHRFNAYRQKDWKFYFWRTSHGAEVDILIEQAGKLIAAIECKSKIQIAKRDFSGLESFLEVFPKVKTYICAPVDKSRKLGSTQLLNVQQLLQDLGS